MRPKIYRQLLARPWAWPLALLALAGLIGAPWLCDLLAFIASSAFLAGTLAATAAGIPPWDGSHGAQHAGEHSCW